MSNQRELEQQLLRARSIGLGLSAVLTSLMVEHAKLIGGDPDKAILRVRRILDDSLLQLSAKERPIPQRLAPIQNDSGVAQGPCQHPLGRVSVR
jgi:hypothetical protein